MRLTRILVFLPALLSAALSVAPPAAASRPNPHAELDCAYCHFTTPRFGVDTRETVTFWRATGDDPALCLRCHKPEENLHPIGVDPGQCRDMVCPVLLPLGASPAVKNKVVCTTCHFLHAANADYALLRGFPGSDRPTLFGSWQALCRQCHGANLERRSPHAGDERSCAFCHPAKPVAGQPATVTERGRRLCEFCHGGLGAAHYAGVNPFSAPQDCTGCHDPHLGKESPGRLKKGYFDPIRDKVTLNPHRKRTLCFACHPDGPAGRQLRDANPIALCQRCHGSGEIPGMSHPMTSVPAGYAIPQGWRLDKGVMTCLTCHQAGHPDEDRKQPHLLRGGDPEDRNAVCFLCHKADQWKGRNPHLDASQGKGCEFCHAKRPVPGTDTAGTVTFVADVNILCLACHDPAPHPGGRSHTVTIAGEAHAVPAGLPLGKGLRITCATCHNPMTNDLASHLLRGDPGDAFCAKCHKI